MCRRARVQSVKNQEKEIMIPISQNLFTAQECKNIEWLTILSVDPTWKIYIYMHADNIVWHKQTFREPMWKKQSSSAKLCESKTSWKVKEKEIVPKDSKYLRPLLLYHWFWLGSCAPARVKLRKMEIWSMKQMWNFGRLLSIIQLD